MTAVVEDGGRSGPSVSRLLAAAATAARAIPDIPRRTTMTTMKEEDRRIDEGSVGFRPRKEPYFFLSLFLLNTPEPRIFFLQTLKKQET